MKRQGADSHTHLPSLIFNRAQCAASHEGTIHSFQSQSTGQAELDAGSTMSYPEFLPTHIGADDSNDKQHLQTSTRRPDPMTVVWVFTGIFAKIGFYDRFRIAPTVQLFSGVAMFPGLMGTFDLDQALPRRSRYELIVPGNHRSPRLYSLPCTRPLLWSSGGL